jgi:type VI secretion system VasD/TssJ family lipoprotein
MLLRYLLVLVIALSLAGCGGASVRIRGVAPLNLNADGESTPVDVRFYPLSSQTRFQGAAFAALWTDAAATLGSELLAPPVVVTVLPGAAGDPPLRVEVPAAAWLGVQVLVRKSDGSPRTLIVAGNRLDEALIELRAYGLRVEGLSVSPPAVPGKP